MSNKKVLIWGGLLVLIVLISFFAYSTFRKASSPGQYDQLAQCLTEKGTKMFGAYWCPHCQNQKKDFGNSWKYVTYIECSLPGGKGQTKECSDKKIEGYPTWEFGNGERMSGEVPFETLAEKSGCSI